MGVRILTGIDAGNNPVKNLRFEILMSDPAVPRTGQVWFNMTETEFRFFDGTDIKTLGARDTARVENETLIFSAVMATVENSTLTIR